MAGSCEWGDKGLRPILLFSGSECLAALKMAALHEPANSVPQYLYEPLQNSICTIHPVFLYSGTVWALSETADHRTNATDNPKRDPCGHCSLKRCAAD